MPSTTSRVWASPENDTALTAFVHVGVERHSRRRLQEAADLEQGLIRLMQEKAPDMARGDDVHAARAERHPGTQGRWPYPRAARAAPAHRPQHRGRRARRGRWQRQPGGQRAGRRDSAGYAAAGMGQPVPHRRAAAYEAAGLVLEHLLAALPPGQPRHRPPGRDHAGQAPPSGKSPIRS